MIGVDRRTERTREAIRAAFFKVLFERGFNKLTITQVIAEANIGRSTFYEHYRTKLDLLSQSLSSLLGSLASIVGLKHPPETLVPLLLHIRQNQALGRELFMPRTRGLVSRVLTGHIEQLLIEIAVAQPYAKPIIPIGLIALQLAEAQLALIEEWSLGRSACQVEQLSLALCASCYASTAVLLGIDQPETA